MTLKETIDLLKAHSEPENVEGMARFGIAVDNVLGVSMPDVRKIARRIGKDHKLALELWATGIHDARKCGKHHRPADNADGSGSRREDWPAKACRRQA